MRLFTLFTVGLLFTACDFKVEGEDVSVSDTTETTDEEGEIVDGEDTEGGDGGFWEEDGDDGSGDADTDTCEHECSEYALYVEEDCLSSGAPADVCAEIGAYAFEECLYSCDDGGGSYDDEECYLIADEVLNECLWAGVDPEECFFIADEILTECLYDDSTDHEAECAEAAAVIELECIDAGVDPYLCFDLSSIVYAECLYNSGDDGWYEEDWGGGEDWGGESSGDECFDAAAEAEGMCLEYGGTEAECAELGAYVLEDCLHLYGG